MSRRTDLAKIVKKAIDDSGAAKESVARAADLSVDELELRLEGDVPFMLNELTEVGGFLHVEVPHLLKGIA